MEVVSPLPVSSPNGMLLIRPLLQIPRKEILACAEKHGIPYREDKTNLSDEYKRNRIRHKVIPVLEELNPSLLATLASGNNPLTSSSKRSVPKPLIVSSPPQYGHALGIGSLCPQ